MKQLFQFITVMALFPIATLIWDHECKVHIENRHNELKNLIGNQSKFDWYNWSNLTSIMILGLLAILIILAYCFIKIKYCPTIKQTHNVAFHRNQKHQPSIIEKPYIIQLPAPQNQTTDRPLQENA
jgi:hypothetical protein